MSLPRALDGIRVVDFSWVRAGPWATRWLGALGAEIIKIEWPENERGRFPSSTTPQDVEVNLNTSGNFNDTNVNKRSLSLNVRTPQQFPLSVPSSLTFIAMERSFGRLATHGALRQVCPPLYRAR